MSFMELNITINLFNVAVFYLLVLGIVTCRIISEADMNYVAM